MFLRRCIRLSLILINTGSKITFSEGQIRKDGRCENVFNGSLGGYIGCDTEI